MTERGVEKARFAVVGDPVAHSRSPAIHAAFAAQTGIALSYERWHLTSEFDAQVQRFFATRGAGLNITVPHKAAAARLASLPGCVASERVLAAGAANTLWMQGGVLHADNTDGAGLVTDLTRRLGVDLGTDLGSKRVLLLGAGGAAAGVCAPLVAAGISALCIANRTQSRAAALIERIKSRVLTVSVDYEAIENVALSNIRQPFDIVINATAAGLAGELVAPPATALHASTFCYDMSYSQGGKATPFVAWAASHALPHADGLGMLVEQAAEAFFIWHGVRPDTAPVLALLRADV
jgi:shikimate dehydrogenase